MNLYPAIDIYEGEVVRLKRGDFDAKTVYAADPSQMARKWVEQGAQWLHVVDLEGAKTGEVKNLGSLLRIRETVSCRIQFGGGLRNLKVIEEILAEGIDRVVIGTKAFDKSLLEECIGRFGAKIALGLDVRDGRLQSEGWLKEGGKTLQEAIEWTNNSGVETLIYTDIQKDGMLQGPNFEGLESVLAVSRAKVILSGGVSSLSDVKMARDISHDKFEGIILGRALYDNKFALSEAVQIASKNEEK